MCVDEQFPFTKRQIRSAFICESVGFNSPVRLEGKGAGIILRAINAGHAIGGSAWCITFDSDTIVYASDFNHANEQLLASTSLCDPTDVYLRPLLMITDVSNTLYQTAKKRKNALFDRIDRALQDRGDVLLPADTSGRAIELALMLEEHWRDQRQQMRFNGLVLYSHNARDVITMIQKMERPGSSGTERRSLTFEFLKTASSQEELAFVQRPMCVIAAGESLEAGSCAMKMFERMCSQPLNLVMLTSTAAPNSLARSLVDHIRDPPPTVHVPELCATRLPFEEIQRIKEEKKRREEEEEEERKRKEEEKRAKQIAANQEALMEEAAGRNPLLISSDATPEAFASAGLEFPAYPFQETFHTYDLFGRQLDYDKLTALSQTLGGMDTNDTPEKESEEKADDDVASTLDPYTTYTLQQRDLTVRCQMDFVEMEGRSDGESLINVCKKVKPSRMILLYGRTNDGRRAADSFIEQCPWLRFASIAEKDNPVVLKEAPSFKAILPKEYIDSGSLTYITGQVVTTEDGVTLVPTKQNEHEERHNGGELWYDSAFVGNLRMDDLIKELRNNDFDAQFSAESVIVINGGAIRIRKENSSADPSASDSKMTDVDDDSASLLRIAIEGQLCEDYYKVRNILYKFFDCV